MLLMESTSSKITKNTIFLYIRQFLILVINLVSVRFIINALGEEDYGIYNVVAGVITMLSFVTASLQSSTQRYYSFNLGKSNYLELNKIFSASLEFYILLSVITIAIGETIGLYFINYKLAIPPERLVAANYVYQFSILSFVISIIGIPYTSAIIAQEDMNVYAVLSIIEGVLKLALAIFLLYCLKVDKLIFYSAVLVSIHVLIVLLYMFISKTKYKYCYYKRYDVNCYRKSLSSFAGWTMFGSIAGVVNTQGNTILINIFFGPIVSASRAISLQISNAIMSFCSGFITAIKPPMVKKYAEGNKEYLIRMFNLSTKFIIYSVLIVCIPLYVEMDYILDIWLKNVNSDMVQFSRVILIYVIIISLHHPITILMEAIGKVKQYYVIVDSISLITLPLSYIFFKLGYGPIINYYITIFIFFCVHIIRLVVLKKNFCMFSVTNYMQGIIIPAVIIILAISFIIYWTKDLISSDFIRFIYILIVNTIVLVLGGFKIALNKQEQKFILDLLSSKLNFIRRKN